MVANVFPLSNLIRMCMFIFTFMVNFQLKHLIVWCWMFEADQLQP